MTTLERALEIIANDEMLAICTACGHEQPGEPDLRNAICENCHMATVQGAEEIVIDAF